MTDADLDFDLNLLIFGFAAVIALFVTLYLYRALRVYVLGRRVHGVVAKVIRKEMPAGSRYRATYSYEVEYDDIREGRKIAVEAHQLSFQEFEVGQSVTMFIEDGPFSVPEILNWRRLVFSMLMLAAVLSGMFLAYHFLIVPKHA